MSAFFSLHISLSLFPSIHLQNLNRLQMKRLVVLYIRVAVAFTERTKRGGSQSHCMSSYHASILMQHNSYNLVQTMSQHCRWKNTDSIKNEGRNTNMAEPHLLTGAEPHPHRQEPRRLWWQSPPFFFQKFGRERAPPAPPSNPLTPAETRAMTVARSRCRCVIVVIIVGR